jgi:hypothetical protein
VIREFCARRVSWITFIRYAKSRTVGKSNNRNTKQAIRHQSMSICNADVKWIAYPSVASEFNSRILWSSCFSILCFLCSGLWIICCICHFCSLFWSLYPVCVKIQIIINTKSMHRLQTNESKDKPNIVFTPIA